MKPGLVLGVLVAAAVLVRGLLALAVPAPSIFIDELLHAELARNLLEGEFLRVRGEFLPISAAYAVVAAPAWLPGSAVTGYAAAKLVGSAAMCLAAVPVWFLARRSAGPRWALLAAGLTLLLPTFALTGALMLETVALPLFALAALAIAVALERPTPVLQGLALGSIALAALARFQGLLLLPILATAVLVHAALARRSPRPWLPSLAAVTLLGATWVIVRLAADDSLVPTLGVYEGHAAAHYEAGEVLRWAAANAGALVLATGVAPAIAFALLLVSAVRGRRDPSNTVLQGSLVAYLAVTAASIVWLVGLTAFAAAWEPAGLKERYAVYAEPLLLVALPVWLARGAPRPRLAAAAAAMVAVALVATLPLRRILEAASFLGNAYGLDLLDRIGDVDAALLTATLAAAAVAATSALAPLQVVRIALPVAVAGLLAAGSWAAADTVIDRARGVDALASVEPHDFVDEALGRDGRALYLNTTNFHAESRFGRLYEQWAPYWLAEVWNRSLRGTVSLGLPEPAPIAQLTAGLDWATGRIGLAPATENVLTDRRYRVAGEELASTGRFRLARVDPPLRLASAVEGADLDGLIETGAAFDVWEGASAVDVVVEVRGPTRVTVESGPLVAPGNTPQLGALAERHIVDADEGRPARLTIPLRQLPARVQVGLSREPGRVSFEPR